jgi:molybdate transport system substrate-binding protein
VVQSTRASRSKSECPGIWWLKIQAAPARLVLVKQMRPPPRSRRLRALDSPRWLALGLCFALSGCAREQAPAVRQRETLTIFAASSLREAFSRMARAFEASHPAVQLTLHFAGSQDLRTQIEQGAEFDVVASADEWQMASLSRQKWVQEAAPFAGNSLAIVVGSAAKAQALTLADLPKVSRIVLGAPEVPVGRYAMALLDCGERLFGSGFRARVEARVVSRELNVKQVLAKVRLGEGDAGIVYATDARTAEPKLAELSVPAECRVKASYPMALSARTTHPAAAREWARWVHSPEGQLMLARAGFEPPEAPKRQKTSSLP